MPWPVTAAKGIASLFKKPKGAIKKGQEVLSPATQLRNAQSAKLFAQMNKKNYSDAFNKSRARINDMKMSPADKDAAVDRLRTFYRNQHSEEMMRVASGRTYDIPPPVTPISELVREGLAFALGGGAGYGIAKNEEAIIDMLKSAKLPTGIDIETTSIGDLMGGSNSDYLLPYGVLAGAIGEGLLGTGAAVSGGGTGRAGALGALLGPTGAEGVTEAAQEDLFPTEFDEVLDEPGLEEGSIGDLLFFNRMFGD